MAWNSLDVYFYFCSIESAYADPVQLCRCSPPLNLDCSRRLLWNCAVLRVTGYFATASFLAPSVSHLFLVSVGKSGKSLEVRFDNPFGIELLPSYIIHRALAFVAVISLFLS